MEKIITPTPEQIKAFMKFFPKNYSASHKIFSPYWIGKVQVRKGESMDYSRTLWFTLVSSCTWVESISDKQYGSGLGISPNFTVYGVELLQKVFGPFRPWHEKIYEYVARSKVDPPREHILYSDKYVESHERLLEIPALAKLMDFVSEFEKKDRQYWMRRKKLREQDWEEFLAKESKKKGPVCSQCGRRGSWEVKKPKPCYDIYGRYHYHMAYLACRSCNTAVLTGLTDDEANYWREQIKIVNNPLVTLHPLSFEHRRERMKELAAKMSKERREEVIIVE